MKKKLLELIVLASVLFSFNGCGLIQKLCHKDEGNSTEVVAGTQNMYQHTVSYVQYQVDSMCVVDGIPEHFEGWIRSSYQDYETNEHITRYMYIKEMNDNYEMVYIVTQKGDIYVVSKRKTVNE